jgi:uncharacterized protein YycO
MPGLGQIAVVRTKGFTSWVIRTFDRTPYNHDVIYAGDGEVYSCEPGGVQRVPITVFPDAVWSHFPLELDQVFEILNFCEAQLGKPYDNLMFVWCGVARILGVKHTPDWILRRLASHRAFICSMLVDAAYLAANYPLFRDGRAESAVDPHDITELFRQHGWV